MRNQMMMMVVLVLALAAPANAYHVHYSCQAQAGSYNCSGTFRPPLEGTCAVSWFDDESDHLYDDANATINTKECVGDITAP